jgi:hypothetical protein
MALECKSLVYSMDIWNILRPFGIFHGHLVYFPPLWYIVLRKIWQPWYVYMYVCIEMLGISWTVFVLAVFVSCHAGQWQCVSKIFVCKLKVPVRKQCNDFFYVV